MAYSSSCFQSTPPRRRRPIPGIPWSPFSPFFNPRLREGGDDEQSPVPPASVIFSIHASAKEATRFCSGSYQLDNVFNPRLREGGDQTHIAVVKSSKIFNPRLREGGDQSPVPPALVIEDFSIHASAKEARSLNTCRSATCMFSIHASAKEANKSVYKIPREYIFNPRLREGGELILML